MRRTLGVKGLPNYNDAEEFEDEVEEGLADVEDLVLLARVLFEGVDGAGGVYGRVGEDVRVV